MKQLGRKIEGPHRTSAENTRTGFVWADYVQACGVFMRIQHDFPNHAASTSISIHSCHLVDQIHDV